MLCRMTPCRSRHTSSYQAGVAAEQHVAEVLRRRRYDVLAQRYRTEAGEIDIIAREGSILHIIEVKRRKKLHDARQCLSLRQRQRIERSAEIFAAEHPSYAGCDWQFDVVFVTNHETRWLERAWIVGAE